MWQDFAKSKEMEQEEGKDQCIEVNSATKYIGLWTESAKMEEMEVENEMHRNIKGIMQ